MPQQAPPQIDFNPQAVQGPFSAMLSGQPTMGQSQPPTGWTTKTGSVLNVVTNFLKGMEKGRVKNYEREEQQRAKERNIVLDYINMKLRDPNLTPEGRAALEKQAMQYMATSVLGDTEKWDMGGPGKKKKGEGGPQGIMGHVVGAFKDIALGMVGGKMPEKGQKLNPSEIMTNIDDLTKQPQFSKEAAVADATKKVQDVLSKIPPGADQQTVTRAIQPHLDTLQKNMDPARYQEWLNGVLGGYKANVPLGQWQHQFVTMTPHGGGEEITGTLGPDGKIYKTGTDQAYTPEELGKYRIAPTGPSRQDIPDKGVVHTIDAQGNEVWTKRADAPGKQAPPSGPPVAVEGPDKKPVYTTRPGAIGKAPAPPAARSAGENIQKQARTRFQKIEDTEKTEQARVVTRMNQALNAVRTKSLKELQSLGIAQVPTTEQGWKDLEQQIIQQKVDAFAAINERKQAAVDQANRMYYPEMYRNDGEAPPGVRETGGTDGAAAQPWTSKDAANWVTK